MEKIRKKQQHNIDSDATTVEVSLPSTIQIELVQGNELRHYEIFFSLASVVLSTAVGFWTSYITQEAGNITSFWSAISFSALALISGSIAIYYRRKVYKGSVKKTATLDQFKHQR